MNKGVSMSDLVSVIIPVYNMEESIEACVKSILLQDYTNIEVILVDDGSKDNSYRICQKIALQDNRVKCIHIDNQGSGPARNVGIEKSKGRYLYFPDADDYIDPNAVSVLVEAMCDGQYDLIVFGYRCLKHDGEVVFEKKYEEFNNTGEVVRADYSDYFGMSNKNSIQGAPWNKFFDGETVRKNNIKYPPLRRHQDEGFISRYVNHCKNIRFIPEVLYSYYQNTVSLEWKKYPVNYVDCVIGLKEIWSETICIWNSRDQETHLLVDELIFSKLMKALELSYSPKMELNVFTRSRWIRRTCNELEFSKYSFKIAGSFYQKAVLLCVKLHLYRVASLALYVGNIKNRVRQGG